MTLESYLRWVNKRRPRFFSWSPTILGMPYGRHVPPIDPADDGPEVIIFLHELKFAEEERNAKPR